jgi:hypothetical protein
LIGISIGWKPINEKSNRPSARGFYRIDSIVISSGALVSSHQGYNCADHGLLIVTRQYCASDCYILRFGMEANHYHQGAHRIFFIDELVVVLLKRNECGVRFGTGYKPESG